MHTILLPLLVLSSLALGACKKDFGVGDPCIPEPIPCDEDGKNCGFRLADTFVQVDAPACEARACIANRLDNGTHDRIPADPRVVCEEDNSAGCVPQAELERSTHCTCRCNGPGSSSSHCECPAGFVCKEVSADPAHAFRGSYCVQP